MDEGLMIFLLTVSSVMNVILIFSIAMWTVYFKKQLGVLSERIWKINNEIVVHSVSLEYAGLIPLPWDYGDDVEAHEDVDDADIKREGNVYYLVQEEDFED